MLLTKKETSTTQNWFLLNLLLIIYHTIKSWETRGVQTKNYIITVSVWWAQLGMNQAFDYYYYYYLRAIMTFACLYLSVYCICMVCVVYLWGLCGPINSFQCCMHWTADAIWPRNCFGLNGLAFGGGWGTKHGLYTLYLMFIDANIIGLDYKCTGCAMPRLCFRKIIPPHCSPLHIIVINWFSTKMNISVFGWSLTFFSLFAAFFLLLNLLVSVECVYCNIFAMLLFVCSGQCVPE